MVRNERLKLLANALDRASTAMFAVGVFAPTVTAATSGLTPGAIVVGAAPWLIGAVVPHAIAQAVLGGLRP